MSFLAPGTLIGGKGGTEFDFNGITNGATLKKIWAWAGDWQIKAIKVWLTDGQSKQFGSPDDGVYSEFEFEDGEHFTSLSLWGNGAGTRAGAIKFKTNRSRTFFACMTEWGLKTEYPVDVGSGICIGITGRASSDIDALCFRFINSIKSAKLKDVTYPTLADETPNVAVEEIKSATYTNNTAQDQQYKIETAKTVRKTSSWSVSNDMKFSFSLEVSASIPKVVDVSVGFGYTMGTKSTYGLQNTEEKKELFSFPIKVAPEKTVDVKITIGRTTVDIPYEGTVEITCLNNSVWEFKTSGVYKGVTYTDAKVDVNEK